MEKEKVIERVKQIKARLLSYPMDAIADIHFILEFSFNLMEEMEKEVEENKRLKAKLDDYKDALEIYSYEGNWDCLFDDPVYGKDPDTNWNADGNGYDLAQETLKRWENK